MSQILGQSKMGILQIAKLGHMGPAWRIPDLARKRDAAMPSLRGACASRTTRAPKQSLSCPIKITATLRGYGNPSWLRQPFGLLGPLMRAEELGVACFRNRGHKNVAQCLQRWGPLSTSFLPKGWPRGNRWLRSPFSRARQKDHQPDGTQSQIS